MNVHDYIAPGEFRYCGQGIHLMRDHAALCLVCQRAAHHIKGKDYQQGLSAHQTLIAERQLLAEQRINLGWPRLFWMDPNFKRNLT